MTTKMLEALQPAGWWVAAAATLLGVGCGVIGTGLYLRDVRRGTTTPHRGSWLVWSVIGVVAAVSHGAGGGRWSLVVLCAQAAGTLVVLCLSVPRGVGGVTPGNLALITVAALGVIGWIQLDDPAAAAACAALADGAGLVAILPKIWADPASETTGTYALAGLGGMLAIVSARTTDLTLLLFPLYYCLANTAVARLIVWRRRRAAQPARNVDAGAIPGTDTRVPCLVVGSGGRQP